MTKFPGNPTFAEKKRASFDALPMRVALATFATPTLERLRFIRQLGVQDVIIWGTTFRAPRQPGGAPIPYKELVSLRNQIENLGMRLCAVENMPIQLYDKLIFGEEGRDQQLRHFCDTIKNTGRAGIPILGYNWLPNGVWRTSLDTPLRGGASGTGFSLEEAESAPLMRGRRFTEKEMWDNYTWFIERVLPVAEEEGVKLALHPNDPPVRELGGVPCLMRSFHAFDKAMRIYPSKFHGLTFCLGNWTAMGTDVFAAIRHFGAQGKLFYAHFQAVKGRVPRFHETFVDQADLDAWKLIKALDKAKFKGVMIPGHVPEMEGDVPWRTQESREMTPYYHPMGGYRARAFTIGYMRGMLHALRGKPTGTRS